MLRLHQKLFHLHACIVSVFLLFWSSRFCNHSLTYHILTSYLSVFFSLVSLFFLIFSHRKIYFFDVQLKCNKVQCVVNFSEINKLYFQNYVLNRCMYWIIISVGIQTLTKFSTFRVHKKNIRRNVSSESIEGSSRTRIFLLRTKLNKLFQLICNQII